MTGIRLLASSAGACFGNLDWDYKRDDDVLRFLRGLIYFASAFVVLLLCQGFVKVGVTVRER
jgi:hypothetical protein